MSSKDGQLQYILVNDFSPGIWSNRYTNATGTYQPAPPGAAQLNGTYGCVSGPTGALVPGPLVMEFNTSTPAAIQYRGQDLDTWSSTRTLSGEARIIGFRVAGPVFARKLSTSGLTEQSFFPDQVFIHFQYYYDNTATNSNYVLRDRVLTFKIYSSATGGTYAAPTLPGNTCSTYQINTSSSGTYNPGATTTPRILYGKAAIDLSRSSTGAPTSPGSPIAMGAYYPDPNNNNGYTWVYPDNATSGTDSTTTTAGFSAFTVQNVSVFFGHQDRICALGAPNSPISQFGTGGWLDGNEALGYLSVNDYSTASGTSLVLDAESPSGYGTWGSMNASTLLLIKRTGGGVLVSGPLEQPIVTKMPGIPGTGRFSSIGCLSRQGEFIYGSQTGIYSWSGGNAARLLSPNFDGPFWINAAEETAGYSAGPRGKFAVSEDFLFCPNDFIMDLTTNSWWKLRNSSGTTPVYSWFDNASNGMIVGGVNRLFNTDGSVYQNLITYINPNAASTATYSWTSHPLTQAMNRELIVREINMTYSGGPFTVTVTGTEGSQSETFPASPSATTPKVLSIATRMAYWDTTVNITGTGSVYSLSIGFHEEEMAR